MADPQRILNGIRVLDFTHVHAGPACTRILADHGAQVIKVESRNRPDQMRVDAVNFGTFENWNAGKLGITLNLTNPKAAEVARRLAYTSDIVIDNFSAGVMRRWGLDYDSLSAVKPDIIVASVPGYGFSGPWRDYVSYGYILHSLTGYFALTGHPGEQPSGPATAYSDTTGSLLAAMAVLFALVHRRRTGQGQFIDVAQLQGITATFGPVFLDYFVNGRAPEATGNRPMYYNIAPHNVYRCQGEDRWCAITVYTNEQWQALAKAMGDPEWAKDRKFASALDRIRHIDELDRGIAAWTLTLTAEEVQAVLQAAGVPAGVASTAADLYENDPQLRLRKYFTQVPYAEGGEITIEGVPFLMSRTPAGPQRGAPLLGEHTELVCKDLLGMSDQEYDALLADGALV